MMTTARKGQTGPPLKPSENRLDQDSSPVVGVFASDLHLQELAWTNHSSLAWDACLAFQALVSLANRYEAPLLLAGDLVDRPSLSPAVAGQLFAGMARLSRPLVYVRGDHDGPWPGWPLALAAGAGGMVVELPGVFSSGGLTVTGLPWLPDAKLREELRQLPAADVVLLHQPLREFADFETSLSKDDLPDGPRLFVVGDIHTAASVRTARGQRVVSPGGTNPQSIRELGPKYAYVLRRDLSVRKFLLPSRTSIQKKVMGGHDTDRVIAEVEAETRLAMNGNSARAEFLPLLPPGQTRESIDRPIVRIDYEISLPGVVERLQAALRPICHLFPVPFDMLGSKERDAEPIGRLETAGVVGDPMAAVLAELSAGVDRELDPVLYDDCVTLLRSQSSPRESLLDLRRAAGVV